MANNNDNNQGIKGGQTAGQASQKQSSEAGVKGGQVQAGGQSTKGPHGSPLSNATYNMVSALHELTDGLWRYDTYIEQENDDDAQEMWARFKTQQQQMCEELKNHLSRRLQRETGPEGKVRPKTD